MTRSFAPMTRLAEIAVVDIAAVVCLMNSRRFILDSAHKSGDAWVRIASSVQACAVVPWEDPRRLEPTCIPPNLIPINAPPAEDCTPEAMHTQAGADRCMDFKGLLFAQPSVSYPPN